MEDLVKLVIAIRQNDAKTAFDVAQKWTPEERESIASYLSDTAMFLR